MKSKLQQKREARRIRRQQQRERTGPYAPTPPITPEQRAALDRYCVAVYTQTLIDLDKYTMGIPKPINPPIWDN